MQGVVVEWSQTDWYSNGTIQTPDGDWFKVKGEEIELDCVGRRLLEIGERVTFETSYDHFTGSGKRIRCAVRVKRPHKEMNILVEDHAELCKVVDEYFLLRQSGGLLLVEMAAKPWIKPGQIVWCRVAEETKNKTWRAWDICLVAENEESYQEDAAKGYGPLTFPPRDPRR